MFLLREMISPIIGDRLRLWKGLLPGQGDKGVRSCLLTPLYHKGCGLFCSVTEWFDLHTYSAIHEIVTFFDKVWNAGATHASHHCTPIKERFILKKLKTDCM